MLAEITQAEIDKGVGALLDDYLAVTHEDAVVIAYTADSRPAAAQVLIALRSRDIPVSSVAMRPLSDPTFRSRFAEVLPAPESFAGRLIVLALEKNTLSHSRHFEAMLKDYPRSRCTLCRVISASDEFFAYALNSSSTSLSHRNAALLTRMLAATRLRVASKAGTELAITLDHDVYEWVSNRGERRDGGTFLLPPGEIATYPVRVDGVLVADGAFNANVFTRHDARLGAHPVHVEITDSVVTSYDCADPTTLRLLDLCFQRPNARRIGELGFGTNDGIPGFIATNSHINERRCGVHIGFGQHNQDPSRNLHTADIHLDLITDGASVWFDGHPEPLDLADWTAPATAHPRGVSGEDFFDIDCCGLELGNLGNLGVADLGE
ncbi:hypothetical protein HII36_07240 [Nonomuraea sp. NN258]|uniref:hypothetical protein n=1 Tax=Nonomuraea antri TaxID=2730852 RepID=UPI001569EC3D|nr:hypothetical protein [Nonomuraea antri]NRQ31635.1 hypothetical protein [Nonomuraea antri]